MSLPPFARFHPNKKKLPPVYAKFWMTLGKHSVLSDEGYFSKQVLKALGNWLKKENKNKKGENRPTCKISENLYYTSCFLSWRFSMDFRLILVSRTTFKEIWRLVEKNPPTKKITCKKGLRCTKMYYWRNKKKMSAEQERFNAAPSFTWYI